MPMMIKNKKFDFLVTNWQSIGIKGQLPEFSIIAVNNYAVWHGTNP